MNVVDGIKVVLAQMQWRLQYTRSWSITEESTKPAINFSPQLNTQGLEVFALVSCFVPCLSLKYNIPRQIIHDEISVENGEVICSGICGLLVEAVQSVGGTGKILRAWYMIR